MVNCDHVHNFLIMYPGIFLAKRIILNSVFVCIVDGIHCTHQTSTMSVIFTVSFFMAWLTTLA